MYKNIKNLGKEWEVLLLLHSFAAGEGRLEETTGGNLEAKFQVQWKQLDANLTPLLPPAAPGDSDRPIRPCSPPRSPTG